MPVMLRGALIEYGSDFLGPIPNVVIFQFNPESLSRTIRIPGRQVTSETREASQAGDTPVEQISLTAYFDASDQLNDGNILAQAFGVGPRLAALEKMVYPAGHLSGMIGAAIDAIGDAITGGSDDEQATQPIPREKMPKLIFIWGVTKILPVVIESLSINEKKFDNLLNPIQAEVSLSLGVLPEDSHADDWVATGAREYTNLIKDAQAVSNLANTVSDVREIIPF